MDCDSIASPSKLAETVVGLAAQRWLEQEDWDCYPEAQFRSRGPRADLIAVKGACVWAIEVKLNFSLQVIEQALRWKSAGALYTSIVTLKPKRRRHQRFVWHSEFVDRALRREGLGLILYDRDAETLQETIEPVLQRHNYERARRIVQSLDPRMKAFTPGSTAFQGYSSPYQRSLSDALKFIQKQGSCSIDELVKNVATHFRIRVKARKFLIEQMSRHASVEVKFEGYRITFHWRA